MATLSKLPGLDDQARVGWEHIAGILDGKARQRDFLEPAQFDPPQWATVELGAMRVERLRRFGEVYLWLALWRRLDLDWFLNRKTHQCLARGVKLRKESGSRRSKTRS